MCDLSRLLLYRPEHVMMNAPRTLESRNILLLMGGEFRKCPLDPYADNSTQMSISSSETHRTMSSLPVWMPSMSFCSLTAQAESHCVTLRGSRENEWLFLASDLRVLKKNPLPCLSLPSNGLLISHLPFCRRPRVQPG